MTQKMVNDVIKENKEEHNQNWTEILDHSYRILIVGGSRSRKNSLFNLISQQSDIYLYAKDSYGLIN